MSNLPPTKPPEVLIAEAAEVLGRISKSLLRNDNFVAGLNSRMGGVNAQLSVIATQQGIAYDAIADLRAAVDALAAAVKDIASRLPATPAP